MNSLFGNRSVCWNLEFISSLLWFSIFVILWSFLGDVWAATFADCLTHFCLSLGPLEPIYHVLRPSFKALVSKPQISPILALLVKLLRIFELRFLGWFLALPRCHEVLGTCLGFASTIFSMSTPSPLLQENCESPQFEKVFSNLMVKLWSFGRNYFGHLHIILGKVCAKFQVVSTPFEWVLSFCLWFSLLKYGRSGWHIGLAHFQYQPSWVGTRRPGFPVYLVFVCFHVCVASAVFLNHLWTTLRSFCHLLTCVI